MFLAIDSTDRTTYLSWQDQDERADRSLGEAKATEALLPALLELFDQARQPLAGLAVVTGPGAFTGIRVGLATAQGLALAMGVPLLGFTRFELLAPLVGDGLLALCPNRYGAACQEIRAGQTQAVPAMWSLAALSQRNDLCSQQVIEGVASRLLAPNLASLALERLIASSAAVTALEPCYVRPADAVAAVPLIDRLLNRELGS